MENIKMYQTQISSARQCGKTFTMFEMMCGLKPKMRLVNIEDVRF